MGWGYHVTGMEREAYIFMSEKASLGIKIVMIEHFPLWLNIEKLMQVGLHLISTLFLFS